MTSMQLRRMGFWSGIVLVGLGLAYLGLIAAMMFSGTSFPLVEPFQSLFNILILVTAAWMVFFWTILNQVVPAEKKVFSQASLALIVIFAALTSINRYVGLTVVRQSLAAGTTDGLQWFMPYGWPSIMLAVEFLAWGFFFALACLCLAPVFRDGRLERSIFWVLIATGILSFMALIGQVTGSNSTGFNLFSFAGTLGWGPGLTAAVALITIWFKRKSLQPGGE